MQSAHKLQIELPMDAIRAFCEHWKITAFAVFGSVLRDDFRPDSDIDALAAWLGREFVVGYSFEQFAEDIKTQDAVMRRIEIIGEATRRISSQFKGQHPDIPWPQMQGMRNALIHENDEVVVETVREVVTVDLGELIAKPEPLVPPPTKATRRPAGLPPEACS